MIGGSFALAVKRARLAERITAWDNEETIREALARGVTDPEAANKMWSEIDKAVTDKAPAAALFTPKHVDFVSKRVGNFIFNAQYYWVVTQSWVK